MLILEKPYASEFLIDTIAQNDWIVLENKTLLDAKIEKRAFGTITTENAKKYYIAQEYPLIYANSENAIDWVVENLPDSNLTRYIKLFKDKVAFRNLIKEMYPDFYYQEYDYDTLAEVSVYDIKYPVVLKPSVGFLSFGVHTINDANEWKDALAKIAAEMKAATSLYPNSVVSSSKFILEEKIEGDEFAIDAYYNRNGDPVILNIFQHPFLNAKDVKDRIYLMSTNIMIRYMAKFAVLLMELGKLADIRNFPMHIELRVTPDEKIIPIEINPMRFAGWCTTDVAKYAWGINPYECFFNQTKPDWNDILENAKKDVFYFSMAEVPVKMNPAKIAGFEYDRYISNFSNILEVRRINPQENPLFAIIFGSTTSKDEVIKILSLKTKDYVISQ